VILTDVIYTCLLGLRAWSVGRKWA